MNRLSSKEDYRNGNKHMKQCSISPINHWGVKMKENAANNECYCGFGETWIFAGCW